MENGGLGDSKHRVDYSRRAKRMERVRILLVADCVCGMENVMDGRGVHGAHDGCLGRAPPIPKQKLVPDEHLSRGSLG